MELANHSMTNCSTNEIVLKEDDHLLFSYQFTSCDYNTGNEYSSSLDCQGEYAIQEIYFDVIPIMESFPNEPLYASLDVEPNPSTVIPMMESFLNKPLYASLDVEPNLSTMIPMMESFANESLYASLDVEANPNDFFYGYGNEVGLWNELAASFEPQKAPPLLLDDNGSKNCDETKEDRKAKRGKEEKSSHRSSCSRLLSGKTISQYFYMPIIEVAKELNVGLTQLKKRCRELGIRRWPHRKLMSLQTLIKNVQEMEKEEGELSEQTLKAAIELLERKRKFIEDVPNLQLDEKTKMLRQFYYKANYKKKKLLG